MLHPRSPLFNRLYEQINAMPVIDCHEHLGGPEERPPYKEPIASLMGLPGTPTSFAATCLLSLAPPLISP